MYVIGYDPHPTLTLPHDKGWIELVGYSAQRMVYFRLLHTVFNSVSYLLLVVKHYVFLPQGEADESVQYLVANGKILWRNISSILRGSYQWVG